MKIVINVISSQGYNTTERWNIQLYLACLSTLYNPQLCYNLQFRVMLLNSVVPLLMTVCLSLSQHEMDSPQQCQASVASFEF
jgi:hypothetical protein